MLIRLLLVNSTSNCDLYLKQILWMAAKGEEKDVTTRMQKRNI